MDRGGGGSLVLTSYIITVQLEHQKWNPSSKMRWIGYVTRTEID